MGKYVHKLQGKGSFWYPKWLMRASTSGVVSGGTGVARALPEYGGLEKGKSLISGYWSLAITASTSGFENYILIHWGHRVLEIFWVIVSVISCTFSFDNFLDTLVNFQSYFNSVSLSIRVLSVLFFLCGGNWKSFWQASLGLELLQLA